MHVTAAQHITLRPLGHVNGTCIYLPALSHLACKLGWDQPLVLQHPQTPDSAASLWSAKPVAGVHVAAVMSQVQIHGGNVTDTLVPETTHVIIDRSRGPASDQASLMPLEVMQAVTSKLGGLSGLRLFRRNLVSGQLKLVAPR